MYYPLKYLIYLFESVKYYDLIHSKFGIKIILHTKENGHNIPHVHVKYQNKEVVLNIKNGDVIVGELPKAKYKYAKQWVLNNQDYLKSIWNNLIEGITI